MKFLIVSIVFFLLSIVLLGVRLAFFDDVPSYQRVGNYIIHPKYGVYPAQVPYEPEMTLYPGQSAIIDVGIEWGEDIKQ